MKDPACVYRELAQRVIREAHHQLMNLEFAVGLDEEVQASMIARHGTAEGISWDWVCFGGFAGEDILDLHVGVLVEQPAWTGGIHVANSLWPGLSGSLRSGEHWSRHAGVLPVYRYSPGVREHQMVVPLALARKMEERRKTAMGPAVQTIVGLCRLLQDVLLQVKN
ncbi:MAG: hypothetical protein AB1576_13840 [Bacillota bacterium]